MTKHKKHISSFRAYPEDEDTAGKLEIFNSVKSKKSCSFADIFGSCAMDEKTVKDYINGCIEKRFLKSEKKDLTGTIEFISGTDKFLGISLSKKKCFLSVIDITGAVFEEEILDIGYVPGTKMKRREMGSLLEEIKSKSKISRSGFSSSGIAIPLGFNRDNDKNSVIFAEEISRIFDCNIFLANEATAAGYCEGERVLIEKFLYLYLDIGIGSVFKNDVIFEAAEIDFGKERRYLRPWEQFSVVKAAKELIGKGLGTTIVKAVSGVIDDITLEIILNAADEGDELAEDLVKRASYALGVRAAYLVNMFDVDVIVLGGGIEGEKGNFRKLIEESVRKFIMSKKTDKLEFFSGEMGKQAPSRGAALLCRRELFMEV